MMPILPATSVYSEAKSRLTILKEVREKLQRKVKQHPQGKIHIKIMRDRARFYERSSPDQKTGRYLSKDETPRIHALLQKRYESESLEAIDKEIRELTLFLQRSTIKDTLPHIHLQNLYSAWRRDIKCYIDPLEMSDADCAKLWREQPFTPKEISPGPTTLLSDAGEIVRSKSELNIANMLYKYHIPYKYECPLHLKSGAMIHPDFTVWDQKRRKEVYWEHRGMMDDREYARHSVQRLKEYAKDGIMLGDNLIITEETASLQLGTTEIHQIIRHHFL